jgi:hypothetical protein
MESRKRSNPLQARKENSNSGIGNGVEIVAFANHSRQNKKLLKKFVDFHWKHYRDDPQYIPLLDYEYLGFRLLGVRGFFEHRNLFFKHADMKFFLALRENEIVGRCNAFVNRNHNRHWKDKVGFFGHFETINDTDVVHALLNAAQEWLKSRGIETIRGPQNMPVNEATPGLMIKGFDSRPVIYYNYNKSFYEKLLHNVGFKPIKRVLSFEVPVMNPMEKKLQRVAQKVIERYDITIESWSQRSFKERKREMFEIYNNAWGENFGFIPFTEEEFNAIINDMMYVLDRDLFQFLYIKGEPAAFLGGVPNLFEKLRPLPFFRRCELLRVIKMFLTKSRIKGFRLGYLGVKKKFQRLGLDGVMIWKQKAYCQKAGLEYTDVGWILEDNVKTIRLVEMMGAKPSKTYAIFEKKID